MRVVLCLDRCTDRTAEIARVAVAADPRFEILEIDGCPEGWAGKVNAIWRGVQCGSARTADLVCFADADTVFEPGCLRAAVALMGSRRADLLSVLSTLTFRTWWERVAQPAACMEMVRQYPIIRANKPPGTRRRPFANGQFMLFRREAYEAVGGHAAVKDELLEDLALARACGEAQMRTALVLGDGLLRCRMYENYEQFRRGWKRIYTECAKLKVARLARASMVVRLFGAVLPVWGIVAAALSLLLSRGATGQEWSPGVWIGAAGLAAWLLAQMGAARAGRAPVWAAPLSIAGAWVVAGILSEAARELKRGVPTRWGGREYVRKPR